MQPLQNIYAELDQPRKVVITMHQKPDADAMGSALGLYHFLIQLGHTVTVISPTNWASFLNWMPDCKKVMDYETQQVAKADAAILSADWIFCLDFNVLNRTKRMEENLKLSPAKRILIDHHREPQTAVFAYGNSDVEKSSTSELVNSRIKEVKERLAQIEKIQKEREEA